jgi:acetylornithine deacetylase/succinyl-diaminopimelate desuccinylase-like protein
VTVALPPSLSIEQVVTRLQDMIRSSVGAHSDRLPTVEPYGISFPGSSLSHLEWCEQIRRLGQSRGAPLDVGAFPSPCDARLFEAFGVPSVVFGPGSLARAHGSDEYVTVSELTSYSKVLAATLLDFFGVDTDERPSEVWQ